MRGRTILNYCDEENIDLNGKMKRSSDHSERYHCLAGNDKTANRQRSTQAIVNACRLWRTLSYEGKEMDVPESRAQQERSKGSTLCARTMG